MIGLQLGHYRITAPLGAGGMGEVWRAEDTRLGRAVALKMLRGDRHEDPDLRARFEREARTVATLAHPNICALFDVGEHDGRHYLVMEYLEGETLADRLSRGPMSLRDAIATARQIADALSEAHARGIVHRDLKPGNVMLTRSGAKLLDFGLARLHAESHHVDDSLEATATASVVLPGALIGTVPYMAPELVQGKPATARSDLWAFGAVLFEMLTGRRVFTGDSSAAVLAEILHAEIARAAWLNPNVPPAVDNLVSSCLTRDAGQRWQSAADASMTLGWAGDSEPPAADRPARPLRRVAPWLIAGCGGALLALAVSRLITPTPVDEEGLLRFAVEPPAGNTLVDAIVGTGLAVSPDGRRIAFVGQGDGLPKLWLWSVTDGEGRALDDTDGASSPFWSPDGRSIAYFAGGKLRRIELAGGPPTDLCEAPFGSTGSWGTQDRIVFSQWAGGLEGLFSVAAEGGVAEMLPGSELAADGSNRTFPVALPDGRQYLFLKRGYRGPVAAREVCLGSFDNAEEWCLGRSDSRIEFVAPDLLLFVRAGTLLAQRVDLADRSFVGPPAAVSADAWWFSPSGAADFSASTDGRTLVTRGDPGPSTLQWYDRAGRHLSTLGDPARYFWPRLSPDGQTVAVCVRNPESGGRDVWLIGIDSGIPTRLTFDEVDTQSPTWSPDGGRLVYGASRGGPPDIFVHDLVSGGDRDLLRAPGTQIPRDWSRVGGLLAYEDVSPSRREQRLIWLADLDGGGSPQLLTSAPASQHSPRFSPDGRTLAFVSEESGRPEVYVVPVRGPGPKLRVSPSGGSLPRWSGDGRELYFLGRDGLLTSVAVDPGAPLQIGRATPMFQAPSGVTLDFDVDAAGDRFLFVVPVDRRAGEVLTVAIGWQSETRGDRGSTAPGAKVRPS